MQYCAPLCNAISDLCTIVQCNIGPLKLQYLPPPPNRSRHFQLPPGFRIGRSVPPVIPLPAFNLRVSALFLRCRSKNILLFIFTVPPLPEIIFKVSRRTVSTRRPRSPLFVAVTKWVPFCNCQNCSTRTLPNPVVHGLPAAPPKERSHRRRESPAQG